MDKNSADTFSTDFNGNKFWNYAHNITHSKAKTLIGHYGFTKHDMPDIEQELLMEVIKKLPHYDPGIAKETTFIMRVTEGKIADLISYRQASCRDWRKCGHSLNAPVKKSGIEVSELIETIANENNFDFFLALDINNFINQLPSELAEICELLKHYTITEILEFYPMSRTTFHHKLKTIKKIFHQHFPTKISHNSLKQKETHANN